MRGTDKVPRYTHLLGRTLKEHGVAAYGVATTTAITFHRITQHQQRLGAKIPAQRCLLREKGTPLLSTGEEGHRCGIGPKATLQTKGEESWTGHLQIPVLIEELFYQQWLEARTPKPEARTIWNIIHLSEKTNLSHSQQHG